MITMFTCPQFEVNRPAVTTLILLPPLVWEPFHGTMYHESILTLTLPPVPFSQPFRLTEAVRFLLTVRSTLWVSNVYLAILVQCCN